MKILRIGVNFDGVKIAEAQNRQRIKPPTNYIGDSFKIFSENKIGCLRVPFYWESYERDPVGFIDELNDISKEADNNNIMCIYDNHQWECSSFLGHGRGFPNSLMSILFKKKYPVGTNSLSRPKKADLELFWNQWWNRKIVDCENNDGWNLQKEFLKKVITKQDNRKSTLGFEILNEPQVFRISDFKRVSEYTNFIIENLGNYTEKPFLFSYVYSKTIKSLGFPWRQAKIKPTVKTKNTLIFDVHPYPSLHCCFVIL